MNNTFSVFFSIIIAVFNNTEVRRAVRSVENQDFNDYEIIIVDDGSNDGTEQIVDELSNNNDKISVIHQSNQWIYASFNNGIKKAKGNYIFILNSDDEMADGSLKRIYSAAIENEYPDVIWTKCKILYCDLNSNVYKERSLNSKVIEERYYNKIDETLIKKLLENKQITAQYHFYKKELMLKHPFRNDYYAADQFFNYDILAVAHNSLIYPCETYRFFQYDNCQNASLKYYGYEHKMFNELYKCGKELLTEKNIKDEMLREMLKERRKRHFSYELKLLLKQKQLGEERFRIILEDLWDGITKECFEEIEEFDARVLSAFREYLLDNEIGEDSDYYFIYELLDSLLKYEKDDLDIKLIESAVDNGKNPYHIGKLFLERIIDNN